MKLLGWLVAFATLLIVSPVSSASAATVVAQVSISGQVMQVSVNGIPRYRWPVSTARAGYHTPTGTFRPQRLEAMWYSSKYENSPMPHSVFFSGGYAVHGTGAIRSLGRPASHGCVRLHPANAATLYALIAQNGMGNSRIVVTH